MEKKPTVEIKLEYPPKIFVRYFDYLLDEVKHIIKKDIPKMFKTKRNITDIMVDDSLEYVDYAKKQVKGGDFQLEYDVLNMIKQLLVDQETRPEVIDENISDPVIDACRIRVYNTVVPMLYLVEIEKEGKLYGKSFVACLEIQL